ncbi:MAG: hypothetical protein GFH27_549301n6 [Chloroflexi bacterium AL-W]|nr:hypothetical protein [Chloroflexi bacterium AL-N1]NOK68199.1 hypothetical protein [Chloroflexi bacterium AL-N10]NOK73845.1 hypothetical protein [Chloroflexi bacterium AL-N5]NOK82813.1 hypothetical protein [Chloroflexi bacterium AL-W]NOK90335.1 hypothetical protein [Chloroflexi bacterium AL-N15]
MQDSNGPKCRDADIRERMSTLISGHQETTIVTRVYVCLACGYTETYTDEHDLTRIKTAPEGRPVSPVQQTQHAATGETIRLQVPSTAANHSYCPICGSDKLIPGVRVRDAGEVQGELSVEVTLVPNAFRLLRAAVHSYLQACVCGSCGYTVLFADDPEALYRAHRDAQRRGN